MKKTQYIELFNNIKSTIVSFISIILFVCLSVAIYTGVSWMTTNISLSIDRVVSNTNYHDGEIMFTYGFDNEDLKAISTLGDNLEINAYKSSYEFFDNKGSKLQALVYEIPKSVDACISVEGELPQKDDEIGIDSFFAQTYNYKIGDTITFDENKSELSKIKKLLDYDIENGDLNSLELEDNAEYLKNRNYTVTCIFKTPRLIIFNDGNYVLSPINSKQINAYMIVNESTFNDKAYAGYTNVVVKNHNYDIYSTYDKEYIDSMDSFSKTLTDKIDVLVDNKNHEIRNKINDIKIDAQTKIEDGRKEIEDAKNKIKQNKNKLVNARKELEDGLNELEDAENQYADGEDSLKSGKYELYSLINKYNDIKKIEEEFPGTKEQLVLYLNEIGVIDEIKTLANRDIFEGITSPDEYLATMHAFLDNYIQNADYMIDKAEDKLYSAKEEIEEGWNTYNSNLDKYNKGLKDIKKAEEDVEKAELDLKEAIEKYDDFVNRTSEFEDGRYGITYRKQNGGIIVCDAMLIMFDKLRYSMAALFVVVGLLVCYSSISRIVNNQIQSIGTKKALGLTRKQITQYYLTYTGIATLTGCVVGVALGYFGIENIFLSILTNTFAGKIWAYFSYEPALTICLIEIVLLLLVTFIACNDVLKKEAISLLKEENDSYAKVRFYEKSKLWNKFSLLTKTIINNFFNDKRRVFATLVGIAGSTALIVTAVTFRSNFVNSFNYQYNEVFKFKYFINFESNNGHQEEIANYLNSKNIDNSPLYFTRGSIKCDDGSFIPTYNLISTDLDSFKKMVKVMPYIKNDADPYKGFWVSGSYANYYGSSNGDVIDYFDMNGNEYEISVDGFFKHYLMNSFVIFDKDTYSTIFNTEVEPNTFVANLDNVDVDLLIKELHDIDDSVSLDYFYETSKSSFNLFDQLSKVILIVYITLSIIMALLVLLNLLFMFIDEKKYELIILMINGFSRKDAKRYIYSDIIALTIVGTIIGILVGAYVGNVSVASFETNVTMILKEFDVTAAIIGTLGSFAITYVISAISLKKIDKFKLADINKA